MTFSKQLILLTAGIFLSACAVGIKNSNKDLIVNSEDPSFQNKGHELVYQMTEETGSYESLLNLTDVVYQYTYRTPDGKEDISTESYIFDGELSHAIYSKHERSLPELEGEIEQGFDGTNFWINVNGKASSDEKAIESVTFTRKTNFYWFTMMQKLLDPGIIYEYLEQTTVSDHNYDVVKISFESEDDAPTDIYQLYINTETHLVDQFLFTVASKGVFDPLLMKVTYEEFEGVKLPTYRKYTKSDWEANVIKEAWIEEISSDLKFNQGLKKSLFIN